MAKKKHTIVQYKSHKKHPVVVKKKMPVFKTALKVMLILLLIAALTILITAWIQVRQESETELKSETLSLNYNSINKVPKMNSQFQSKFFV